MTRIAIAAVGDPLAPSTWSGVPAGLAAGLRELGIEVLGVDATPPSPLREAALAASAAAARSRVDAWYTAGMHALRDRIAARRLAALGPVDGVVLCGAEFGLPAGTRYAVWTDMTMAQAREVHPVFQRLSERTAAGWERRRGAILERAAAVAAAGHWTAASVVEDEGVDPAKVFVVGFGRNHDPAAHAGPWSPPRYLFVGREWERKHGPLVVEAFAQIRAEHPEARLDVVGGHPPLSAPGVVGHGLLRLDDARDAATADGLFTAATCFVMPSEVEPFGIVYAEAAAAGVPSIATAVGAPSTILGDDGGVLVPPGDREALVAAMRQLADPAVAERMGAAARRRAELFSWPVVAGRMLRALAPPGVDLAGLPEPL